MNSEVQDTRKRQTDLCTFQSLWSVVGEVGRVDQLDLWRVDPVSVRCDSTEELFASTLRPSAVPVLHEQAAAVGPVPV